MKPVILLLAGVALVAAQYFPGEPSCAIPCLTAAITQAGCSLDDISCQCGPTKSAIGNAAVGCLLGNCNGTELIQAQNAGNAVCSSLSAGELTISSTAAGSATTTGSISITSAPSTSATGTTSSGGGSLSNMLTRSGETVVSDTTAATGTKTLGGSVATPTASSITAISATTTANAAPTVGVANIAGGVLAGVLGFVAAL